MNNRDTGCTVAFALLCVLTGGGTGFAQSITPNLPVATYTAPTLKRPTAKSVLLQRVDAFLACAEDGSDSIFLGDCSIYVPDLVAYRETLSSGGAVSLSATNYHPVTGNEPGPNGIVYYRFTSGLTDTNNSTVRDRRSMFLSVCREWEAVANIKFVEVGDLANVANISFINVSVSNDRNNAQVGRTYQGSGVGQTFEIQTWEADTILHEIGHTLGFIHEHQRVDRDDHIFVNNGTLGRPNNLFLTNDTAFNNRVMRQFEIWPFRNGVSPSDQLQTRSQYDYQSIMNYSQTNKFSK